jgi:polar amino acid transport system substrate-binding protein
MSTRWVLPLVFSAFVTHDSVAASSAQLTYTTEEYYPTNYQAGDQVKGLSVDLLKLVWKKLGIKQQKIHLLPWARAYSDLLNKQNRVLFSMARTAKRDDLFQWACPIETVHYVLFALKKNQFKIKSADQLTAYQIGTIRSDGSEQLLRNEFDAKLTLASNVSMAANLKKLSLRRIDMIAYSENMAATMFLYHGYDPADFEVVYSLKKVDACFAFSKDVDKEFVAAFQNELTNIVTSPVYKTLIR